MRVDWNFCPERDINWAVTSKRHRPPSHLVALIEEPSDVHYGEIAQVNRISSGHRVHVDSKIEEPCLLFFLIVSSGDHGWWSAPQLGRRYLYGFHPMPPIFYRFPANDDIGKLAQSESWGARNFFERAVKLRLNGYSGDEARLNAENSVKRDYEMLFAQPLVLDHSY